MEILNEVSCFIKKLKDAKIFTDSCNSLENELQKELTKLTKAYETTLTKPCPHFRLTQNCREAPVGIYSCGNSPCNLTVKINK